MSSIVSAAATETEITQPQKGLSAFERYLSVWVILCIIVGIILGKTAPGIVAYLDDLAIY